MVERDGAAQQTFELTPVYDAKAEPPRRGSASATRVDNKQVPFCEAIDITVDRFWFVTKETRRRCPRS